MNLPRKYLFEMVVQDYLNGFLSSSLAYRKKFNIIWLKKNVSHTAKDIAKGDISLMNKPKISQSEGKSSLTPIPILAFTAFSCISYNSF